MPVIDAAAMMYGLLVLQSGILKLRIEIVALLHSLLCRPQARRCVTLRRLSSKFALHRLPCSGRLEITGASDTVETDRRCLNSHCARVRPSLSLFCTGKRQQAVAILTNYIAGFVLLLILPGLCNVQLTPAK